MTSSPSNISLEHKGKTLQNTLAYLTKTWIASLASFIVDVFGYQTSLLSSFSRIKIPVQTARPNIPTHKYKGRMFLLGLVRLGFG